MFEIAALVLIWSFVGVPLAFIVVALDCSGDECSRAGGAQVVLALGGALAASGAFLTSKLRRGRPGLWLVATGTAWTSWAALLLYAAYG
jgi:hypothetical protein